MHAMDDADRALVQHLPQYDCVLSQAIKTGEKPFSCSRFSYAHFRMQICTMRQKGVLMPASVLHEVAQSFSGIILHGIDASTMPAFSLFSTQSAAPLSDEASTVNQDSHATSFPLLARVRSNKMRFGAHRGLMDGLHHWQTMRYRHMSSSSGSVRWRCWMGYYRELNEYKEAHGGHCHVPRQYKPNPPLGNWVQMQRHLRKKRKLGPERERLLAELGIVWEPQDEVWGKRFLQLKDFQEVHRNCNVPHLYNPNPSLGNWVKRQRALRNKCKLEPQRERMLAELGFVWEPNEHAWEKMSLQLKDYQEVHGNCNVPRQYKPNPPLESWVGTQRQAKAKGKLDPKRQQRLTELGFYWGTRDRTREEEELGLLEDHGDSDVPIKGDKAGSHHTLLGRSSASLGTAPRQLQNENQMTEKLSGLERKQHQLLSLPSDVGLSAADEHQSADKAWEEKFRQLKEYKAAHGDCNVPRSYEVNNVKLGLWAKKQRQFRRRHTLDPEHEQRLSVLGFPWECPQEGPWEEMFRQLKEYKAALGHCLVPGCYNANPHLGSWVEKQLELNFEGKLDPEKERRLREFGFSWAPL